MALKVEMLLAERGDALLIEYGHQQTHRVLIDGGPVNSDQYDLLRARIEQIPPAANGIRYFDLLVISHVDADHIEGVIRLLQDTAMPCVFDDIWFNGWKHMAQVDEQTRLAVLGGKHGEFLGALLDHQGRPWNQLTRGGPVFIPDHDAAERTPPLPRFVLRGGLELTLLSPTVAKLQELAVVWEAEIKEAGFEAGDTAAAVAALGDQWWAKPTLGSAKITKSPDHSEANGASIAFLAEYAGESAVLAADAHDDVLTESFRRLRAERDLDAPMRVGAFKLSHHGSKNNTTDQLLDEVLADHYLVSTSGDRFNHPNSGAIKRIIDKHADGDDFTLRFNYDQDNTSIWKKPELQTVFGDDATLVLDG